MPTQQQDTRTCPECGHEIDHLNFQSQITQWGYESGSCDLDGDNFDYTGDTEISDSNTEGTSYFCPECGEEVQPEELEPPGAGESEEDEAPSEPQIVDVERPQAETTLFIPCQKAPTAMVHQFTCHYCRFQRLVDIAEFEDQAIICDNCGKEQPLDETNLKSH